MWEMVETFIYYWRSKKWPLPLAISLVLIAGVVGLSLWQEKMNIERAGVIEWAPERVEARVQPSPLITSEKPFTAIKPEQKVNEKKHRSETEQIDQENNQNNYEPGNVSHFKDSLTDTLKVEGLEPAIAAKIFKDMRDQLDKKGVNYDIESSIRYAIPDASDDEVYRIRELVLNTAEQSFEARAEH